MLWHLPSFLFARGGVEAGMALETPVEELGEGSASLFAGTRSAIAPTLSKFFTVVTWLLAPV